MASAISALLHPQGRPQAADPTIGKRNMLAELFILLIFLSGRPEVPRNLARKAERLYYYPVDKASLSRYCLLIRVVSATSLRPSSAPLGLFGFFLFLGGGDGAIYFNFVCSCLGSRFAFAYSSRLISRRLLNFPTFVFMLSNKPPSLYLSFPFSVHSRPACFSRLLGMVVQRRRCANRAFLAYAPH